MKTCPKCKTSMPDDVNFCTECGTKMEQQNQTKVCISCGAQIPNESSFCPECGAKQNEETNQKVDIYECVNEPEISIQCGYGLNSPQTVPGSATITPKGIIFESNAKGVSGFFASIATLGQKTRMGIPYKEITHIGVVQNGYLLYIATNDGSTHTFSGPSAFALGENKKCVKKLAYLIELYRRMYWYYGGYEQEFYISQEIPVGYFQDAVIRVDNLSDEELIHFYQTK